MGRRWETGEPNAEGLAEKRRRLIDGELEKWDKRAGRWRGAGEVERMDGRMRVVAEEVTRR